MSQVFSTSRRDRLSGPPLKREMLRAVKTKTPKCKTDKAPTLLFCFIIS